MRKRLLGVLVLLAVLAAACGSDDTSSSDEAAPANDSEPADASEPAPVEWVEHKPGGDCQCADGGEFSYFSRDADPDKVLLYFQGGGACFSAESCSFTDGTYLVDLLGPGDGAGGDEGIFDAADPDNPFADHSVVFVPYCTGDVHLGNNIQEYSDDLTVNHVGFVNASAGFDHVIDNYSDASEVVVAGSSAGSIPSPLFAGLVADELPDAEVAVVADASGGYPDNPPINATIGGLWGVVDNLPDWESVSGLTDEQFSIPGLFEFAGLEHPDIRFARYDNAYDDVQQSFSRLSAAGDGDVLSVLEENETNIEAAGVDLATYIAPGTDHTILASPAVYDLEVEGSSFIEWLTRFLEGEDVDDVACTECGEPDPDGADIGG